MARPDKGRSVARKAKRYFGTVRTLPSGRLQARYTGPDGATYTGRTADGRPLTFDSEQRADAYLARVHGDIQAGRWISPDAPRPAGPPLLAAYAPAWLASRKRPEGRDLADLTRELYAGLLDAFILPAFGDVP